MSIILTKLIEDFDNLSDRIYDNITYDSLVGISSNESADRINNDSSVMAMNLFLYANGFKDTHCQVLCDNIEDEEMELMDIAFFHYGKFMTFDGFRKYIQTGCEVGYSIKLLKKSLSGIYMYPLYLTEIGATNRYSSNKKNSIILDSYDKAKAIIEESDIPKNIYDIYLIQLHDKPFKDREFKYWKEDAQK